MKRFYVNVHYDAIVNVEVEAETEEEALEKAQDIAEDCEFDDVFYSDSCITGEDGDEEEDEEEV